MSKQREALEAARRFIIQAEEASGFREACAPPVDLRKTIDAALAEPDFDPLTDIDEFHRKFGPYYEGKPRVLSDALRNFRIGFMQEETQEYVDNADPAGAMFHQGELFVRDNDQLAIYLANMLDALVDLTYVALGTAHLQGFNFREAWRRVHAANMKKERVTSPDQSTRNSIFDVRKPKGWQKPSHADLVEDHAHRE